MAQVSIHSNPLGSVKDEAGFSSRSSSAFRIKGHFSSDAPDHDMEILLADHRRTIARGTIASEVVDDTGLDRGLSVLRSEQARPGGIGVTTDLAQDLHDCGGYHLALLQISLKLLDAFVPEGRGRAHLDRTKAQLARFAADLGSIAARQAVIARAETDSRDLEAFLVATPDAWSLACGLPVDFRCNRPGLRLPVAIEQPLLRVLQESLTNVLKHARTATRVTVDLSVRRGFLTLTVADDGCGFDPPPTLAAGRRSTHEKAVGQGLPGMAARMARIGGRLTIESARGHGTRIRARLRLPA